MRAACFGGLVALALAVPAGRAALPNDHLPGQRIDLKVLLLSADGAEPGFAAWQAQLDREGVPYDTLVAYNGQSKVATLTDDRLADYGAGHAKYQAVILASGDLGLNFSNRTTVSYLSALSDAEWAALAKFERTFGIRRLSDFTAPSPEHGLNIVPGIKQDGLVGTLTAAGKAAFPYLKGPIPIADDAPTADDAFGYQGTPVNAANWQTLVAAPTAGAAYLGIFTRPDDGREEMVMTVASNQFQSHNQALRHGMLNWVTRGVFLGYQRNYLGLDIDDIFLPDDKWDAAANVTDYRPESAIRMTAQDVTNAVEWQRRTGLKMNMVYNMGGVDEFGGGAANDELLARFKLNNAKNEFRWINHTLQHPNLDCSTASFIANQIVANRVAFNQQLAPGLTPGLSIPSEVVAGEHSGLANTRPGNPGTIDPPNISEVEIGETGGALTPGSYEYGVSATTTGETPASVSAPVAVAAGNSVTVTWSSICWATSYKVYRRPVGGAWSLLGTSPGAGFTLPTLAFTDAGAEDVTFVDSGAAGTTASPPAANNAALAPYRQNPAFIPALTTAQIRTVASDASKAYPNPPTKDPVSEADPNNFPKGASFAVGPAQAVPRYPSNVYYNVANRADQLDEYNWIYTSPPTGGCVPIANVTTCNVAPVSWDQYLASETRIIFGHVMGNDPRPHYFHQTNIAQSAQNALTTDTAVGGTLYAVIDTLLARICAPQATGCTANGYDQVFDRGSAPLVQLSQQDVAAILVQQSAWAANRGNVSAWLQDGAVHIANRGAAAVEVPVTGTTVGAPYGGHKSGWISVAADSEQVLEPNDPAKATPPTLSGAAKVGETLTAAGGTWTGTPEIVIRRRWQRCDANGCAIIPGATGATYEVAAADVGARLRVVAFAGNWISSVGQAASALTEVVPKPPARRAASKPDSGSRKRVPLVLKRVRMSPRRFPVAHRRPRPGTRLDGSTISWRLNKSAKVRLKFQRARGPRKHPRWVKVGAIKRTAKAGAGVVRFRGRFGQRLLAPGRYRLVITAKHRGQRSAPARVRFKVVRR